VLEDKESALLNTEQVAHFVAEGLLCFESLIPEKINQEFLCFAEEAQEEVNSKIPKHLPGTPFTECLRETLLESVIRHPRIQGAIFSLLGRGSVFDHHHVHITYPKSMTAQHNHQDSTIDPREKAFDIQILYFPQRVTASRGGTRYIPGSHLRKVHESQIARYQNFLGQVRVCCPSGTVMVLHHGLWHGGGRNTSDRKRYMYKLRLQPTEKQSLLWDTSDLNEERICKWRQPIFQGSHNNQKDPVPSILMRKQPWFDNEGRLELINRIKFWRLLLGSPEMDVDYWMSRLEQGQSGKSPVKSPQEHSVGVRRDV